MARAMNDHGWVERRSDGTKADCGGPFVCESCTADLIEVVHSEVNPFYSLMVRTIDRLGKRVGKLEESAMGSEKTVWDGAAFAELAARLKDVEDRLDKLERPQDESDANMRRRIQELSLHVKARQGEIERLLVRVAELERENTDLQAENNRMLSGARAAASNFETMLGKG